MMSMPLKILMSTIDLQGRKLQSYIYCTMKSSTLAMEQKIQSITSVLDYEGCDLQICAFT